MVIFELYIRRYGDSYIMERRKYAALRVNSQTMRRLEELYGKYGEYFSTLDELLMDMMDAFDERMACPRGGARGRGR